MMKSALYTLALPLLLVVACANVNDKTFNGRRYGLDVAEFGQAGASNNYTYTDRSNPNHIVGIESYRLGNHRLDEIAAARIRREQQLRKNDCRLERHRMTEGDYYLCRFNNSRHSIVIYTFGQRDGNGYLKVFIDKNPATPPSPAQIERWARELYRFQPI